MTLTQKIINICKWYKRYDTHYIVSDCVTPIDYENFTIQDDIDLMFYMENRSINVFIGSSTEKLNLTHIRESFLNTVDTLVRESMEEIETCLLHITVKNGMLTAVAYPSTSWNQTLVIDVNVRQINTFPDKEPVDMFSSAVKIMTELTKHWNGPSANIDPNSGRKIFAFKLKEDKSIDIVTFVDAYFTTDNKLWMNVVNFVNDKSGVVYNTLLQLFEEVGHTNIRLVQWGWTIGIEWGKVVHNDGDLEHGNIYYASPKFTTHVTDIVYVKEVSAHARTLPHRS